MILALIFDALKTAYEKTEQKERLTQHKSKKKKNDSKQQYTHGMDAQNKAEIFSQVFQKIKGQWCPWLGWSFALHPRCEIISQGCAGQALGKKRSFYFC